jgi:hypothetical protein
MQIGHQVQWVEAVEDVAMEVAHNALVINVEFQSLNVNAHHQEVVHSAKCF